MSQDKNKNARTIIKVMITLLLLLGIYLVIIYSSPYSKSDWKGLLIKLKNLNPVPIIVICLLAPVNWLLESYKWKILVSRIEKLDLKRAYMAVLTGLSYGFVTPRSIGDYFGRMLHLKSKSRVRVVGALLVSRLSQLFITLMMGGFGFAYFTGQGIISSGSSFNKSFLIAFVLFVLLIIAFLFRKWIIRKFFTQTLGEKIARLITIIKEYNNHEIIFSLILSLARYLVFSGQFTLLLLALDFDAGVMDIMAAITLVYMAKTAIVSFNFLSDLGGREIASLGFLGAVSFQPEVIIAASLGIWLINILLPTLVGALLTIKIKLRPEA